MWSENAGKQQIYPSSSALWAAGDKSSNGPSQLLHVGLYKGPRDQPNIIPKRRDLPCPEMRSRAGHHADQAGLKSAQSGKQRASWNLLLQENGALPVKDMKLKNGLVQINSECCRLHVVGSFFFWLSHSTNLAQCDAVGVEPSIPSEELAEWTLSRS